MKKITLTFLLGLFSFFAFSLHAQAAITFIVDASSTGTGATVTFNATTTSAVNGILVVSIARQATAATTSTAVTFNGVALTRYMKSAAGPARIKNDLWYLINPPVGNFTVSSTFTAATDAFRLLDAAFYGGVNQSSPFEANSSSSCISSCSTVVSSSLTTITNNDFIIGSLAMTTNGTDAITPLGSATAVSTNVQIGATLGVEYNGPISPAVTTSTGWTDNTEAPSRYNIINAAMVPASISALSISTYTARNIVGSSFVVRNACVMR